MRGFDGTGARAALLFGVASAVAGCALGSPYGFNYLDPRWPRYARSCGEIECGTQAAAEKRSFRLVSFNIKFSRHPARAVDTLRAEGLADADVLLLQEMDWRGSEFVARCLGYNVVYYPAAVHPSPKHDFGVALLARWPIREDRKILLPSLSRSDDAGKIALAATVWVSGVPVRVVNAHLQSGLTAVQAADQAQVAALCAVGGLCPPGTPRLSPAEGPVVMAGDFNTMGESHIRAVTNALRPYGLGRVEGIEGTFPILGGLLGRRTLDHVFASLEVIGGPGHVASRREGSDHLPVTAELALPQREHPITLVAGAFPKDGPDPAEAIACEASQETGE